MEEITIRIYKYNINLPFYKYSADSYPHKIKAGKSTIIPGLKYSLVTILLGFIGHIGWRKSVNALSINFSGGLDYTKEITELDYDKQTIYIYNNLPRNTFSKVKIEDIEILIELEKEYLATIENSPYSTENMAFLKAKLRKVGISNLNDSDLGNFFSAFENAQTREW